MTTRIPDSLDRLTQADLIGVVRELIGEVGRLRAENEKLDGAFAKLKTEHQAVKDELARLKNLPPRPPQKPSGMDKATDRGVSGGGGAKSPEGKKSSRRRGSQLDKLTIGATVVVRAKVPAGSRHKGYEEIVVQDLCLSPQVTRYRRERWQTPAGETVIAALDPGIVGGYGPNLLRFVLALHFSGQVTCERIVALLNGMGVVISKRQVVRLLTAKLETFRAEDETVLKAGLGGPYVTVDNTGARHAGESGYTTQIGSDRFTVFRTGPSKSRQAFLARLCGGTALYVINAAALGYMKDRQLPQTVIDKFADHKERIFSSSEDWERHLQALGITDLKVAPDPVLIASEGALWGAIRHQGLLEDTVIVSDDAGQFRVGVHALCWVQYLESDLILGIPPSMPMNWGFEAAWTQDKFQASAKGAAHGGATVQIPLRTTSSIEVYVANQEWRSARLPRCPLHPAGGCGFARHGSYERVTPPRLRIARWYCRQGHRTFSLLPDFLAARLPGTLALIEHCVAVSAAARSVELAAEALRGLDISLPSAVRWLRRRLCAVRRARDVMSSMAAIDLCVTTSIPLLRHALSPDILSRLPSPVGFRPP